MCCASTTTRWCRGSGSARRRWPWAASSRCPTGATGSAPRRGGRGGARRRRSRRRNEPPRLDLCSTGRAVPSAGGGVLSRARHRFAGLAVAADDGRVGIDWGIYGVPETFLVDRSGRIRYKHVGVLTERDVERTILPLVARLEK